MGSCRVGQPDGTCFAANQVLTHAVRLARVGYAWAMKTYTIELQRIKGMSHSLGMVRAKVNATVLPATPRGEDAEPLSTLTLTVENARVLFLLLKAQLAEVDGRKGRSQR